MRAALPLLLVGLAIACDAKNAGTASGGSGGDDRATGANTSNPGDSAAPVPTTTITIPRTRIAYDLDKDGQVEWLSDVDEKGAYLQDNRLAHYEDQAGTVVRLATYDIPIVKAVGNVYTLERRGLRPLTTGDFNGDGWVDAVQLVGTYDETGRYPVFRGWRIQFVLNDGTGKLKVDEPIEAGTLPGGSELRIRPQWARVADSDGDGKEELYLAVSEGVSSEGPAYVIGIEGIKTTYRLPVAAPDEAVAREVGTASLEAVMTVADVNNDKIPDFVELVKAHHVNPAGIIGGETHLIHVMLSPKFERTPPLVLRIGSGYLAPGLEMQVADVDGDGKNDVLVNNLLLPQQADGPCLDLEKCAQYVDFPCLGGEIGAWGRASGLRMMRQDGDGSVCLADLLVNGTYDRERLTILQPGYRVFATSEASRGSTSHRTIISRPHATSYSGSGFAAFPLEVPVEFGPPQVIPSLSFAQ